MNIRKNKDEIFAAIQEACQKAQRSPKSVNVIAVTKYVDSSITKDLIETGIQHIGENRVDKFLAKYKALADKAVSWHFIGSLQRRKVKEVINYVDYFHALDSVNLAKEIQKRAERPINCFLQVNISKEESKHGFQIEELPTVLEELQKLDNIRLVGLMTMAPLAANQEELLSIFSKAQELQKELASQKRANMPFTELSIGMSRDFEQAILCGSTFVRIGTAFFK